jgi:hypothetical protein
MGNKCNVYRAAIKVTPKNIAFLDKPMMINVIQCIIADHGGLAV